MALGYLVKNGKALKTGYTTGSCATAASAASARMLLTQNPVDSIEVRLPDGSSASFEVIEASISPQAASCSVIKDAGDDPDVTHGIKISATCEYDEGQAIIVKAGPGVGTVTSKGLACKVGEPAINPVPMKMIKENINAERQRHDVDNGLKVTISALNGEEIAKKTFNPRLGIVGGISILGTTGIVEPMSEKAIIDTVKLTIDKQHADDPDNIIISIGNYGRTFSAQQLGIDLEKSVKTSNFIGEALDYIYYKKFKKITFIGHFGKLVKIAGGIMNTHSKMADCRMDIICAHAACLGADQETARKIMEAPTTDEALDILQQIGIMDEVFQSIMEKIIFHLSLRTKSSIDIEVIMFADAIKARGNFCAES